MSTRKIPEPCYDDDERYRYGTRYEYRVIQFLLLSKSPVPVADSSSDGGANVLRLSTVFCEVHARVFMFYFIDKGYRLSL